jgi:excisionase family DNA binding protein
MAVKKLDPLYTVADAAEVLNVSEKTVRRLIKDEFLRAIDFRRDDGRRGQAGLLRLILRTLPGTIGVANWPTLSHCLRRSREHYNRIIARMSPAKIGICRGPVKSLEKFRSRDRAGLTDTKKPNLD